MTESALTCRVEVSRDITKPPFVRLFSHMPGHIDAGLGS